MARLLLGVSGGIAAYKALEIVRLATKAGHSARVIQTPASQRFVGAASFAALTGAPVLTSEFERDPAKGAFPDQQPPEHDPASHLELVRNADVYLIAPATANTLAKLAHGLADNLLTSAALAAQCPVVVAPAMNNHMWEHSATTANLATLSDRGVAVVPPETGELATKGEYGVGRLAEPADVLAAALHAAGAPPTDDVVTQTPGPLAGRRVLVTAGGTREPIDAVRYVGNRSSGRMGFALAEAASALGADVTVISANVALPRAGAVSYIDVETAAQLHAAALQQFPETDLLLMAAAVADFRPAQQIAGKQKKAGLDGLTVELEPTEDTLMALAQMRTPGQVVVGFAAEHGPAGLEHARGKRARKQVDLVVHNDVADETIGFDSTDNAVTIIGENSEHPVPKASKDTVARAILEQAAALLD